MYINSILIADDHELILTGIKSYISQKFMVGNISTFTRPEDVAQDVERHKYDIYLLDLEYKEMSGFELIKIIRKKHLDAKIIICTMHEEIWNINHMLELNVNGILLKKTSEEYLEKAIVSAINNSHFMCPRFKYLTSISHAYRNRMKNKNPSLTKTESVVLKLIVEGYTSKEIAEKMFVTENAIELHRKNLLIKCDARNVAHLVSIAIHQRLLNS